jgi:hypothetical protein
MDIGTTAVVGGVDAVSYELMRASVINEWAAAFNNEGVIKDYFTQWVLTFPTKHYYVDLQDDPVTNDDFSPTLQHAHNVDIEALGAFEPFYEEFVYAYSTGADNGESCEDFRIRMWNREEASKAYLSPGPGIPVSLCYETNVIVWDEAYTDRGLDSQFAITIPVGLFPVDPGPTQSERGWASVDFYDGSAPLGTGIGLAIEQRRHLNDVGYWSDRCSSSCPKDDLAGLPVTGFMFSVFNTNAQVRNHTTINSHKYRREELISD